jgi:hypothetical protein
MLSNIPSPAHHVDAVDDNACWLSPPEQSPPPLLSEIGGCITIGHGGPTPLTIMGPLPAPDPPSILMSRCILPSQLRTAVMKIVMITLTQQMTFSLASLFGFCHRPWQSIYC